MNDRLDSNLPSLCWTQITSTFKSSRVEGWTNRNNEKIWQRSLYPFNCKPFTPKTEGMDLIQNKRISVCVTVQFLPSILSLPFSHWYPFQRKQSCEWFFIFGDRYYWKEGHRRMLRQCLPHVPSPFTVFSGNSRPTAHFPHNSHPLWKAQRMLDRIKSPDSTDSFKVRGRRNLRTIVNSRYISSSSEQSASTVNWASPNG